MKFVLSYSFGKDSTLALDRMLEEGHEPVGLLVMYNKEMERSWFHGVDDGLMDEISRALGIPMIICSSSGEAYHTSLEDGLRKARVMGAEVCVFGDIDIDSNARWCRERCEAIGIQSRFPLWQEDRRKLTHEVIEKGYQCVVKIVRNQDLPQSFLGKIMDDEMLTDMENRGIDICGENGEYHTVVVNGPIFKYPVSYECKEILDFGNISAINIIKI